MRLSRLIDLDEPGCVDARLTGAKAATLAQARAQGFPVLPGVVVPVAAGAALFRRALDALETGGSGAARLAVIESTLEPALLRELEDRVRALGGPMIVRSSSPLEASGDWAGAFSTFHDVVADELATAVRGCWSSAFSVDALERAEAAGVVPEQLRLAVLVQPQLTCEAGGVARALPDGRVEIIGVRGAPAPLLSGWEPGMRAEVLPGGAIEGGAAVDALGTTAVLEVAELAARVHARTGLDRIEWARAPHGLTLLQIQRSRTSRSAAVAARRDPGLRSPTALRVAQAAHRWAGPVGEEQVLPWALTLADLPAVEPQASDRPLSAWREARERSRKLVGCVWPSAGEAQAVLADLRGAEFSRALARVEALPVIDRFEGERVLHLFAGVGVALVAQGVLRAAEDLWRCLPADVERCLERMPESAASLRQATVTPWEPFVHAAVTAHGTVLEGLPAVPGVGAGSLCAVRNPHDARTTATRPVLVVERPLPGLAPLLWNAAGLVVGTSNAAAHLLEVASSVGVPSVVGVDVTRLLPAARSHDAALAPLVAVDGNTGTVAVVEGTGNHARPELLRDQAAVRGSCTRRRP